MPTAEWVGRVDQNDIHIACELHVLKTVVEDEPLNAALGQFIAARKAITRRRQKQRDLPGALAAIALHRW